MPLGKGRCFFRGTPDAADQLAVKHGVPTGRGTDILFDARASEQQGRSLAHRKRWYTPAQALKLATAENTVRPEQVRPAQSLFRRSGCHPEGRPCRPAAGEWRPDDDPTQNLDLVADPDTNFTVIMKVGTGHKNTLWEGAPPVLGRAGDACSLCRAKLKGSIASYRGFPMSIDIATARKVAKLARIRVEEADLPKLAEQLSGILGFMEQLNEVDVEGIEPMVSVTPMRLARRADVVTDGNIQAQVLANAPDAREGFFAVPKVVE